MFCFDWLTLTSCLVGFRRLLFQGRYFLLLGYCLLELGFVEVPLRRRRRQGFTHLAYCVVEFFFFHPTTALQLLKALLQFKFLLVDRLACFRRPRKVLYHPSLGCEVKILKTWCGKLAEKIIDFFGFSHSVEQLVSSRCFLC